MISQLNIWWYMISEKDRKGPFVYNCLYAKFELFPSSKFSRPTCRIAFARERLPKGGHPLGRKFEVASTMRHAETQNRSGLISLYFFEKTEEVQYKKWMVFWCILPEFLKFHGFSTRCSHICPILIFPATPNLILLMICRSFIAWDWSGGIPCSWPWQRYLRPGFLKSWGITSRHDGVTYTKSWSCLMT